MAPEKIKEKVKRRLRLIDVMALEIIPNSGRWSYPFLVLYTSELFYRYMGYEYVGPYCKFLNYLLSGVVDPKAKIVEMYFNMTGLRLKRYRK